MILTIFSHSWDVDELSLIPKMLAYLMMLGIFICLIFGFFIGIILMVLIFPCGVVYRFFTKRWPSWCRVDFTEGKLL